jgi:DNA polymerase-1
LLRLLFDIEADALLPDITKIHCICTVNIDTEETRDFGPAEIPAALEYLASADVLSAHFGVGYDFPALEKVLGFKVPEAKQLDTVVISRVRFPNLKELDKRWNDTRIKRGEPTMGEQFGSHSIEAWGVRLSMPKLHTDIADWSEWTPQIQERCHGDVQTNLKLWKYLKVDKMSQAAIALEHRTQRLCNKITEAGWPFDVQKAGELHAHLLDEKHMVEVGLKEQFGGWFAPKGPHKGLFVPKKNDSKRGYVAGQACTKLQWVEFNPGSRKHIERCLRKLGWEPTEFTEKGSPELNEEVLDGLEFQFPQAAGVSRYLMLCKRLGQLAEGAQAWLKHVTPEGKVHCQYNPMGTVTSRMAHYGFNIGQVPAGASPYGHECRECFTVLPAWELVGADMDGLEGRCQAHYQAKHDGGEFGRVLLSGDPHWANAIALGLLDVGTERVKDKDAAFYQLHTILREQGAKRWYYAWIYGSGKEKSGRIILDCCRAVVKANPEWAFVYEKFFGGVKAPGPKLLKKVGGSLQEKFFAANPALAHVITTVKTLAVKSGSLPGLDGRRVPVRSEHSAFNALLQSAGAILCKRWICDAYDALIADGLRWGWDKDFVFVANVHDEVQVACRCGLSARVGALITQCAREAGEPYGFRIPLDSSYKVGKTWATTH